MKPWPDERIGATLRALEAACRENKIFMSGDQRVSESDAAYLLGLSGGGLKNLRHEGAAPVAYRMPINGARVSYRLMDLAAWIESRRGEC
ncbi:MAG: hypothetical protein Q8P42_06085 [Gallionella sp.]|nr:hypothetical protein [Gallionella sp.]